MSCSFFDSSLTSFQKSNSIASQCRRSCPLFGLTDGPGNWLDCVRRKICWFLLVILDWRCFLVLVDLWWLDPYLELQRDLLHRPRMLASVSYIIWCAIDRVENQKDFRNELSKVWSRSWKISLTNSTLSFSPSPVMALIWPDVLRSHAPWTDVYRYQRDYIMNSYAEVDNRILLPVLIYRQ